MNDVAASLAQLGVSHLRESTLVGPDGDSTVVDNGEHTDKCAEHPTQTKDVFCVTCQIAICSQDWVLLFFYNRSVKYKNPWESVAASPPRIKAMK